MLRLLVKLAGARPVANAVQVERRRAANAGPEGPQVRHAGQVLQQQSDAGRVVRRQVGHASQVVQQ